MKPEEIQIGQRVWTHVAKKDVEAEVVGKDVLAGIDVYILRRVDTGTMLPKLRTARALHRAPGPWKNGDGRCLEPHPIYGVRSMCTEARGHLGIHRTAEDFTWAREEDR